MIRVILLEFLEAAKMEASSELPLKSCEKWNNQQGFQVGLLSSIPNLLTSW